MVKEDDGFVVGPQATGGAFIGRSKEIRDIEETVFYGIGAVHLVGPTHIGKSSLVSKVYHKNNEFPNRLKVTICMGECVNAYDFWNTLADEIKAEINSANINNKEFYRHYDRIENAHSDDSSWFLNYKGGIKGILKEIRKQEYRLILSIDEFDAVVDVFGQASYYFQLLRTIYYDPTYATSGIIISRRRLHLLEAKCNALSTFHGVFRELPLRAFSAEDMQEYYEKLHRWTINVDALGRKRLERYTGCNPYICNMLAARMVSQLDERNDYEENDITNIFISCRPQIDVFYDDLIDRLEEDHHIEAIFYLSLGLKLPNITQRDIENLLSMGVLSSEEVRESCDDSDDSESHGVNHLSYYAYSQDFMVYFRSKPLKLPAWEKMTLSEKCLKDIIEKEYPVLSSVTNDDIVNTNAEIINQINSQHTELHLNKNQIKAYCDDLSAHKPHPTILDVLPLSKVIAIIIDNWNSNFQKYFKGEDGWKNKLLQIKRLRNPMAHAQLSYVNADELAIVMKYCDELIHLHLLK